MTEQTGIPDTLDTSGHIGHVVRDIPRGSVNELSEVLNTVREHLGTYLMPASEDDLDLLALWAVSTHLAEETYTTPRLIITSPVAGSGKTTVLEHFERLVPNPVQMASVSSSALIPRLIDAQPSTLLIDEAEKSLNPNKPGIEDILGVINSGYKRGGSRPTLVPDKESGWRVQKLSTFAPVAMAGNSPHLPDDTVSRAHTVTMFPALEGDVEETDWEVIEGDVLDLGQRIAAVADTLRETVRNTRPPVPSGCVGRIKERWLPLKRIAALASVDWSDRVDQMILHDLESMQRDKEDGLARMPIHVHLIRDMHEVFEAEVDPFIGTEVFRTRLIQDHPTRWGSESQFGKDLTAKRMAQMLNKNFTIRAGKSPDNSYRGYWRRDFERAWRAVGVTVADTPSIHPSNPSNVSNVSQEQECPHGSGSPKTCHFCKVMAEQGWGK
ncbi:DUF3631 domain-containing protein [Kocuria rosea]|uniref:DUF3631 domain-containing protein n=1 Tax=Kocuria rosea TaxID=1275 RepID=UPI002B24C181|nr:DUF3631 domain-containing protein [Kocuria rosea]MEB2527824.1 DUF3631 domain-containing protein [Kocuria rosea]MEB2617726.1 DUF3631 domain-containing protein [Kocuria rosea]